MPRSSTTSPGSTPPFQPLRAIGSVILIACGFGLYEYLLVSFWSVPWMGIHDRVPWPAFAIALAALVLSIAGLRLALGLASPHAKLGFGLFAFLACIVVGAGGGRFVSYAMRATLNPPYKLTLAVGQRFPNFALTDQNDTIQRGPLPSEAGATLVYVYRGDYDPFARFELAELTAHADDFKRAGVDTIAISTDQIERSKMLAGFLRTKIPLLSDKANRSSPHSVSSNTIETASQTTQYRRFLSSIEMVSCDGFLPRPIIVKCLRRILSSTPQSQSLPASRRRVQRRQHRSSSESRRVGAKYRTDRRDSRRLRAQIARCQQFTRAFGSHATERKDRNCASGARRI